MLSHRLIGDNIPSSFFSSSFSSAAPPAAAPPAAGAAPPAPPEGTDASLLEPSAINYPEILAVHLILHCILYCAVAYLLEILALKLGDESGEALIISFDTDGFENGLDVLLGRRRVAAEGEEEVGCEMLHFVGYGRNAVSMTCLEEEFRCCIDVSEAQERLTLVLF